MSRTRVRAEDLFCARCHRAVRLGAAHWPEGYLCPRCYDHALETYGTCTGCVTERLTHGLAPDGGKLCTDCAGGLGDFTCERCGQEARRYRLGVCGRCVLHEPPDGSPGREVRRQGSPLATGVHDVADRVNDLSPGVLLGPAADGGLAGRDGQKGFDQGHSASVVSVG